MQRIARILPHCHHVDGQVLLDHDRRTKRRAVYTTDAGERILLDMADVVRLKNGNGLELEDGRVIAVEAEPEPLIEIRANDFAHLVRIAWHLGNRHLPTQTCPAPGGGTLRIRYDHVIASMVEGLGGKCIAMSAPFDPEDGAYAKGEAGHHHHGHHHHHDHHESEAVHG